MSFSPVGLPSYPRDPLRFRFFNDRSLDGRISFCVFLFPLEHRNPPHANGSLELPERPLLLNTETAPQHVFH